MKHLHYYIEAGDEVTKSDNFYIVAVGHGKQADRDFLFLTAHAVSCGHFFEVRSAKTQQFVSRLAESLQLDALPFKSITARDLVRHFKANTRPAFAQNQLDNDAHARRFLSTNYRVFSAINRLEAENR